jgi:hypothetical protein
MPKSRIDELIDVVTSPYRDEPLGRAFDYYGVTLRNVLDTETLYNDPFGTDDCPCDLCTM